MKYLMERTWTDSCCKLLKVIKIQGEIIAELVAKATEQENLINSLLSENSKIMGSISTNKP